jgi:hypothetical protein
MWNLASCVLSRGQLLAAPERRDGRPVGWGPLIDVPANTTRSATGTEVPRYRAARVCGARRQMPDTRAENGPNRARKPGLRSPPTPTPVVDTPRSPGISTTTAPPLRSSSRRPEDKHSLFSNCSSWQVCDQTRPAPIPITGRKSRAEKSRAEQAELGPQRKKKKQKRQVSPGSLVSMKL